MARPLHSAWVWHAFWPPHHDHGVGRLEIEPYSPRPDAEQKGKYRGIDGIELRHLRRPVLRGRGAVEAAPPVPSPVQMVLQHVEDASHGAEYQDLDGAGRGVGEEVLEGVR